MIIYGSIILVSWAAFVLVWAVSALNVKRDVRGGYAAFWKQYWLLRIAALGLLVFFAVRIATRTAHFTNGSSIFLRGVLAGIAAVPPILGWIAAVLTVAGISFAMWARFSLGRNWSPRPAVKEKHELVTSGPYAYVRHPIYTGIILAAFALLITGTIFGIFVFLVACGFYLSRIDKEERIMLELFPNEYPAYQKRTKRLIPFVW